MSPSDLKAAVSRDKYTILGYVSSEGHVCNLKVRHLPTGETYTHLVRRAFFAVDQLPRPDHIEPLVWEQAVREQKAAWLKRLHEKGDELKEGGTDFVHDYWQLIDPHDPSAGIAILHVLAEKEYVTGGPKRAVKPVAIAKEWIKDHSELKDYTAKLLLAPGKFQEVVYAD